jgi:hypothetical protein
MTREIIRDNYRVWMPRDIRTANPIDNNDDVHVYFPDGRQYAASFFTIENLRSLFRKNRCTGERASGTYLWSSGMIVVEQLTEEVVLATIDDLLAEGELDLAFEGPFDDDL